MKNPTNLFKAALKERRHQLGIWNTIGGNTVPELLGGAGFDWVLVDCEHAAIETVEVLPALQAIATSPKVSAIVRPADNDATLFKRILDMGAQSLLVPYVQTVAEAENAVAALRYGPHGVRGMAGMTRATRYGKVDDYFAVAYDEMCLILQIETVQGLKNLEAIATTEGVDAIFIGPADLSASMGLPGQMDHPDVVAAIHDAIERLQKLNVPVGLMALDPVAAKDYIARGVAFTAVGVDLVMLADAAQDLRQSFDSPK
ncbi:4-hydroxy-2-oxo-heptane-1,7-dioate aldolase [Sulfitobacter sp. SK012]|uniref:HpcH/HpaI aldolase family protein n=1 Tax=Sulfitobacter sp. SK012 TaxID=1389005 RepID=UPI000E0BDBB4|nr:aldolase/citrate lyase family protein [Sulfitobacter sp. SK012]AXI47537.1 4-hydroxy-2-oxo-heptane-1,7-dioate aldolase [Sulfitobacter sp. SK012]